MGNERIEKGREEEQDKIRLLKVPLHNRTSLTVNKSGWNLIKERKLEQREKK